MARISRKNFDLTRGLNKTEPCCRMKAPNRNGCRYFPMKEMNMRVPACWMMEPSRKGCARCSRDSNSYAFDCSTTELNRMASCCLSMGPNTFEFDCSTMAMNRSCFDFRNRSFAKHQVDR